MRKDQEPIPWHAVCVCGHASAEHCGSCLKPKGFGLCQVCECKTFLGKPDESTTVVVPHVTNDQVANLARDIDRLLADRSVAKGDEASVIARWIFDQIRDGHSLPSYRGKAK